jgi:phenylalanyl-tRNA synthetase beta chain
LPDEFESLCLVEVGADARAAMHWWNEISASLEVGAQLNQESVPAGFHPTRSATLARGKIRLGAVGEIDPAVLARLGVHGRVACLELNASMICGESPKVVLSKQISKFPPSDFDLAFVVDAALPAGAIVRALRQAGGALLDHVRIFDVFSGGDLPNGSRSIAVRLRLRAGDRTLTDEDVALARDKCIEAVAKVGGKIRQ